MSETHFDIVIVGGGPAGYGAALYGASAGLTVGMVERDKVGGTCLQRGCIPAKELLETAAVTRTVREAHEFGVLTSEPGLDFTRTMQRKQAVIDQLTGGVKTLLKRRKVVTFDGTGRLGPNRTVTIDLADGSTTTITG